MQKNAYYARRANLILKACKDYQEFLELPKGQVSDKTPIGVLKGKKLADKKRKKTIEHHRASEFEKFIRQKDWDWFCTITAKHCLTLASARRAAEQVKKRIQRAAQEDYIPYEQTHEDGLLFWVAEPHKHTSSGYHLHFLLKLPTRFVNVSNKKQFKMLLTECRKSVGGPEWKNAKGELGLWHRCLFEPYKGKKAATYCAKYVSKDLTDYDILTIL